MSYIMQVLYAAGLQVLLLAFLEKKGWRGAIAGHVPILCLYIINNLIWKHDGLSIWFSETLYPVGIGLGISSLLINLANRKDRNAKNKYE